MPRRNSPSAPLLRTHVDYAIEGLWLLALILVPIAFSGRDLVVLFLQPKDFILHFVALLIVVIWGFEWALGGYRPQTNLSSWTAVRLWLGRNPRNWALTAAAGFGITSAISAILSPMPAVSVWGRDFSQLGYELYGVLSFLVIFFAIALRVKNVEQVRRIFWVIAGTGAVTAGYGISQHFGWDPIGNGAGQPRVMSSFGNPIFFGSYLLMSVMITLGLAFDKSHNNGRWWLVVTAVLVGVQFAALWFTGSRGPWIGTTIGLVFFVALSAYALDRSRIVRTGTVLLAGVLIAVVVVNLPGDAVEGESRGLGSIVSGVTPAAGGLSGRTDIWQGSARLLGSWERQASETAAISALRPVFGLGQEMYYYSYPLSADPQKGINVVSNAHNLPLQMVLELGITGLILFTALTFSVFVGSITFIRRRTRERSIPQPWLLVAMIAVIAALVGRSAEQMVGLGRVGDLVPFWALLAISLAVYRIGVAREPSGDKRAHPQSNSTNFPAIGAATIVGIIALTIFAVRDVQMLRAGIIAADAFEESAAGNTAEAIRLLKRASDISPDVQQYHVWAGDLLVEEARGTVDPDAATMMLRDARETFGAYESRDALAYLTQIRLGLAEVELANRGNGTVRGELIERSLNLADAMPAYPKVQALAAERVLVAGQLELGLHLAERAIAMESEELPQPLAWFMRGNALADLGDVDGALVSWQTSLERDPEGQLALGVHRNMALAYESIGEPALAAEHLELSDEIRRVQEAIDAIRGATTP